LPEISPRIFKPAPITDEEDDTGATVLVTNFGAVATGAGDGATACGLGIGEAGNGCAAEEVVDNG
jgi:hypothetical protein